MTRTVLAKLSLASASTVITLRSLYRGGRGKTDKKHQMLLTLSSNKPLASGKMRCTIWPNCVRSVIQERKTTANVSEVARPMPKKQVRLQESEERSGECVNMSEKR